MYYNIIQNGIVENNLVKIHLNVQEVHWIFGEGLRYRGSESHWQKAYFVKSNHQQWLKATRTDDLGQFCKQSLPLFSLLDRYHSKKFCL